MTGRAQSWGTLRIAGFELTSVGGSPRLSSVSPEVASELTHHATTQAGVRELADFVGVSERLDPDALVGRVLAEVECGRVVCRLRQRPSVSTDFTLLELDLTEFADLEQETTAHVVALELVDQDGLAVAGAIYRLTLPDGEVVEGRLDGRGTARVSGLPSAAPCQVCFPELDAESWSYVHATPV